MEIHKPQTTYEIRPEKYLGHTSSSRNPPHHRHHCLHYHEVRVPMSRTREQKDQAQKLITKIGLWSSKIISGYQPDKNLGWVSNYCVKISVGLWVGHGLPWFPVSIAVKGECFTCLSSTSSSSSDRAGPGPARSPGAQPLTGAGPAPLLP